MVRRLNVMMAVDGILYDVRLREEQGYRPEQNVVFFKERLSRLHRSLDQERRAVISDQLRQRS